MTEEGRSKPGSGIIQEDMPRAGHRFVIVSVLVLAFVVLSIYFHFERREGIGYSHFAYIPIIFAAFWWGRKAVSVAAVLAVTVIFMSLLSGAESPIWADVVRALSFLIVAFVIGELSAELIRTHKALKEREERLRRTNSSLRKFSQQRRAFLHIAIHDMKSPVSATKMLLHSLQTLMEGSLTKQQEHLIMRMHARLDEATSFLRDFQLFAQLEDISQLRKQAVRIDLNEMIGSTVELNSDLASNKDQRITAELQDDLPYVGGVERLLREVLHNLITNAIKYTPDGGRIVVRSRTKGDRLVSVEVQDSGIGISAENQKELFREFFRIKDTEVDGHKVGGIGLGLSIVKRIMDMHGGRLYVVSEPGKGSIFGFDLRECPEDEGPFLRPGHKVAADLEPVMGRIPG